VHPLALCPPIIIISAAADRAELERRRLVRDAETRQRRAERRQIAGGDGGALGADGADGGVDDDAIGADGNADSVGMSASGRKLASRGSVTQLAAEGGVDGDSGYGFGAVGAGELGDETPTGMREGGRSMTRLGASNVSNATVAV
jgi:hypothetical protein